MTRFLFLITIFILFILEGTIIPIFSPEQWGMDVILTPRFILVLLVFYALFFGRLSGLWMGVMIGLIYDITYGPFIGIHAFAMPLVGYASGMFARLFRQNVIFILFTVVLSVFTYEWIVFGLFSLLDIARLPVHYFMMDHVVPTLVLNTVFALLVAYPARTMLVQLSEENKS